jgi:hypothetical protein
VSDRSTATNHKHGFVWGYDRDQWEGGDNLKSLNLKSHRQRPRDGLAPDFHAESADGPMVMRGSGLSSLSVERHVAC